MRHRPDIIRKHRLSREDLAGVRRLESICHEHEGIALKLNWNMLENRRSLCPESYFIFDKHGRVAAFLGVYQFQSGEAEISGMVHPAYRRQGLFRAMAEAASSDLVKRGVGKHIYICQRQSASGKAFLQTVGAEYRFSEYTMELAETPESDAAGIRMYTGGAEQEDLLIRMNAEGFGMNEADARAYLRQMIADPANTIRIAEDEGQAVGTICVTERKQAIWVIGFTVLPEYRGRGLGRRILRATIGDIRRGRKLPVFLEVASGNGRALGLYTSCGFNTTGVNDYYEWNGSAAR